MAESCGLGPAPQGHLQVEEVGAERLEHRPAHAGGGCRRGGALAVARSSTTSMPMDEPPKRGLTMYGPVEADLVGRRR